MLYSISEVNIIPHNLIAQYLLFYYCVYKHNNTKFIACYIHFS